MINLNILPKFLKNFNKLKRSPILHTNFDVGTTTNSIRPLTLEEILKAFNQAKTFHLNRINGKGWLRRAEVAGFTSEEIPRLRQELTTQLNRVLYMPKQERLKQMGVTKIRNAETRPDSVVASQYALMFPGNKDANKVFHGIELHNPNLSYLEAVDEFVHELGHGMTSGISTTAEQTLKTTPIIALESKAFPLTLRLVDYNASLLPKQSAKTLLDRGVRTSESGLKYILDYLGQGLELMARAYVGLRRINNLYGALKKAGKPFEYNSAVAYLRKYIPNMKELYWHSGNNDINMYKKALGIAAPVGIGLGIYNNQNES